MSVTYVTGPAGAGKTTYAVTRLRDWLTGHIPPGRILVLVPQLTLAQPYQQLLRDPNLPAAGAVDILTLNGLAMQTIDLFWPLGASATSFGRPHDRPIFLNIEQAQYYLRQAIEPLLQQGYFDPNVVPVTISLPRLMSQLLDNLNKAALIGLPHTQVGERLAASIAVDPSSRVALEHTQACVNQFRQFCLERNLLDFSLRIETFYQHLWPTEGVRRYLTEHYRYLIADNIEEDTPFAHTVLRNWLPHAAEALLVNDEEAGYRIFLGANWQTAAELQALADETIHLTESHIAPPDMLTLGERLGQLILGRASQPTTQSTNQLTNPPTNHPTIHHSPHLPGGFTTHHSPFPDPRRVITFEQTRFYPQMIDWVVNRIAALLEQGVSPNQIVVLAPFVSDALRFAFVNRMAGRGLPARSHRPSRPLNEEPAAKTMLTLARLAFPHWRMLPAPFDVAQALHQAITDLDLIRANLLTQVVYRQFQPDRPQPIMTAFEEIEGDVRDRISYQAGVKFDHLRGWLLNFQSATPPVLDHFFSRLFGELLSQPGFGFHGQPEAGEVSARLIDSARQFRRVAERVPTRVIPAQAEVEFADIDALNRAYLENIEQGLMAAQYVRSWSSGPAEAVLITPATTFLMANRPVDYQFWLDAGSSGWWERIAQPLTHPYVLSATWDAGRPWTDEDEVAAQRDRLYRLVLGLTRRCRKQVIIVNAEIGEQGYEQRGQLLVALQQLLRQLQKSSSSVSSGLSGEFSG